MRSIPRSLVLASTAIIAACAKSAGADAQGGPASPQPASREDVVRAETFASGLDPDFGRKGDVGLSRTRAAGIGPRARPGEQRGGDREAAEEVVSA